MFLRGEPGYMRSVEHVVSSWTINIRYAARHCTCIDELRYAGAPAVQPAELVRSDGGGGGAEGKEGKSKGEEGGGEIVLTRPPEIRGAEVLVLW